MCLRKLSRRLSIHLSNYLSTDLPSIHQSIDQSGLAFVARRGENVEHILFWSFFGHTHGSLGFRWPAAPRQHAASKQLYIQACIWKYCHPSPHFATCALSAPLLCHVQKNRGGADKPEQAQQGFPSEDASWNLNSTCL